jgi:DNA-binding LytR/AlgR family response regulator
VVRYGEHIKTIETTESAYFYTENKANFLVTKENKRFAIDHNLDQLEELLDPRKFFRINRQFIIGFHAITDMFTYSKSRVLIKLNPPSKLETIVSSERSASFKSWLDG